MLTVIVALVLVFLLVLATKAFKSKTVNCSFKITVSLIKGFSLEFSTTNKTEITKRNKSANKKDAPTDNC